VNYPFKTKVMMLKIQLCITEINLKFKIQYHQQFCDQQEFLYFLE